MPKAIVKVSRSATPPPRTAAESRRIGRELNAAVESLTGKKSDEWFEIGQFSEKPKQAYWFSSRLRRQFQGFEFSASVADGVGRLYARVLSQT